MSDTIKPGRSIPRESVFVDTKPFWEGIARGKLVLQYCTEAKRFQHYPRPVSQYTGRRTLEWREVSGNGTVYAATIVRVPSPGLEGRVPLSVVTVDLDEGVRILGNVLGCNPEEVKIGARVMLAWDDLGGGRKYPAFVLA